MGEQRTPLLWRVMRAMNRRGAAKAIGSGRGPQDRVLLLTTIGRTSGLQRVTPLQYEDVDGTYCVMSARGPRADWFRNVVAHPHVTIRVRDRVLEGDGTPIVDAAGLADFLELRLQRHPVMMRMMLMAEGVPPWAARPRLERFAAGKAMLRIRVVEPSHSDAGDV
ncbi:MAG: nitroreductase family deazaflavin-dependent oxidoreductase [Actinomycetales bacterium]|nr:nitroreductase family deazaflavin-dependent oxidoreductase [Actinomycetales bacterium]